MFADLTDVRIFAQLASVQSFADIGRHLDLPPATVSRRIQGVEQRAGLRLIERSTRHFSLNPSGQVMVEHAQRMVEELESVQLALDAERFVPRGKLRISAPVILGQALMGPLIAKFVAEYPECQVFADLANRRVDLIEEGFDIAIRVGKPGELDLIARSLGHVTSHLYAHESLPPHLGQAVKHPEDLTGLSILDNNDKTMDSLTLIHPDHGEVKQAVQVSLVSNDPVVLHRMAMSGRCPVVLPDVYVNNLPNGHGLSPVLPEWHIQHFEVFAVFVSRKLMRPAVRAFVDLLAEQLEPH